MVSTHSFACTCHPSVFRLAGTVSAACSTAPWWQAGPISQSLCVTDHTVCLEAEVLSNTQFSERGRGVFPGATRPSPGWVWPICTQTPHSRLFDTVLYLDEQAKTRCVCYPNFVLSMSLYLEVIRINRSRLMFTSECEAWKMSLVLHK